MREILSIVLFYFYCVVVTEKVALEKKKTWKNQNLSIDLWKSGPTQIWKASWMIQEISYVWTIVMSLLYPQQTMFWEYTVFMLSVICRGYLVSHAYWLFSCFIQNHNKKVRVAESWHEKLKTYTIGPNCCTAMELYAEIDRKLPDYFGVFSILLLYLNQTIQALKKKI